MFKFNIYFPLPFSWQIQQTTNRNYFVRKQALALHANCLLGDNLHEISEPVFWGKKKFVSNCRLLIFLASTLSIEFFNEPHNAERNFRKCGQ